MTERFTGSLQNEIKEQVAPTPYVVSADIKILLGKWADRKGYTLPGSEFFSKLRQDFSVYMKRIFPGFELVSEEELTSGLKELVESSGLLPISLDRVYYSTFPNIDIARRVDIDKQDKGLGKRADAISLLEQFKRLRSLGVGEVVLVDDVIFTGDLIRRISSVMEGFGLKVKAVCTGIGVGEGIDALKNGGQEVRCVRSYADVIDEICERDFYPGVPLSGRLVRANGNIGAPYILPFGNPGKWASIPEEWQLTFSRFCIERTIKLFEAIEEKSGREVKCSDLDRKVISLPKDETRFATALRNLL